MDHGPPLRCLWHGASPSLDFPWHPAQSLRGDSRESPHTITAYPRTLCFFLRAPKRSASLSEQGTFSLSDEESPRRRHSGDDNRQRRRLTRTMRRWSSKIDQRESIAVSVRDSRRRPDVFRHFRSARNEGGLWAAAFLDNHARQSREHDLVFVVEIQHCDFGQFPRCAARPGVVRRFRQADDMRVWIGRKESHRTVARAVIGIVSATQTSRESIVNADLHFILSDLYSSTKSNSTSI